VFFPNATAQQVRGGAPLGAPARVQVVYPSRAETINAAGGIIPTHVRADALADWVAGDRLVIQSLDGFTALPEVVNYRVSSVTRLTGSLPATDLELAGGMK